MTDASTARRIWMTGIAAALTGAILFAAQETPAPPADKWNVQEAAGVALMAEVRCSSCHTAGGATAPIAATHITHAADWMASHVSDAKTVPPATAADASLTQRENDAILAALLRMRTSVPPPMSAGDQRVAVVFTRTCLRCHAIDGAGSDKGPDLTGIGTEHDAAWFEQWIIDPTVTKPETDMPSFGGKLAPDDIKAIAAWLATEK
jgi:mono/diheme cytochrome c family protein